MQTDIRTEKQAVRSFVQEHILEHDDNTEIDLTQLDALIKSKFYEKVELDFIIDCLKENCKGNNAPLRQIKSIYGVPVFYRNNKWQRIAKIENAYKRKFVNRYV